MEKPPFQFGLKSVFVAMTGVAIFMAVGETGRIIICTAVAYSPAICVFCVAAHWLLICPPESKA